MQKSQVIVMWVVWFAFFQGVFILQLVIGGGVPSGENATEPMAAWIWVAGLAPLLVATLVRWAVIPRLPEAQPRLVAMIVGLSLSELPVFVQLFVVGSDYPVNQMAILMPALLCMIQFAPTYATPSSSRSRFELER